MAFSKVRILSIKLGAKANLIKGYLIVLPLVFFSIFHVNSGYAANVGDSFAGGTVFCVSQAPDTTLCVTTGSGCYGLIMANEDQVNYNSNSNHGVTWSRLYYTNNRAILGYDNGAVNTAAIIAAFPNDNPTNNAAWVCRSYTGGGYTDWYLPSKNELNKMYVYANANNLIGGNCAGSKAGGVQCLVGGYDLNANTYWSSTAFYNPGSSCNDYCYYTWYQLFSSSVGQYSERIGDINYFGVRAARAFSNSTIQLFNNLHKSGYEDVDIIFTDTDFTSNFGSSCSSLTTIKITGLPIHGTLKLSDTIVSLNQEIPINSIVNLTYTPNAGYAGSDSFNWNGSNGDGYAPSDAKVNITITEINNASSSSSSSSSQTLEASSSEASSSKDALSLSSSPATNHDSSWTIPAIVVPSVIVGVTITTAAGFILYRHGVLSCFRKEGMPTSVEMGTHESSNTIQSTLSKVESSIGHLSNVEMEAHESSPAFQTIFTNV